MLDMKNIGIFYGSTTGATEQVAKGIASHLGVSESDVHDVTQTEPSAVGGYDVVLFGASTWGDGDLQDDMHDFLDGVSELFLKGRYAAVFGCGDETMSDTFCNGVGTIYDALVKTGATMIGKFNADGYSYDHSDAERDGSLVGLVIDNVNHEDMTDARIEAWTDTLKREIA